jgi:nitrogen fixation protein FixH
VSFRHPFHFDDDHPFTGRHMLAVVLLFFGTVIAVNIVMAAVATGTFPGLVVRNGYVASQSYSRLLAEAQAQAEAGWRMALAAPGGVISLRLADRDGTALRRLEVKAAAGRPSTAGQDRTMLLLEEADGYRATEALPPGQWEVTVEARRDGERVFAARRRIHVSAGETE